MGSVELVKIELTLLVFERVKYVNVTFGYLLRVQVCALGFFIMLLECRNTIMIANIIL